MDNLLTDLKQKAIQAHNWTSFSPDRRGEQMINDYSAELQEDADELKQQGIDQETINGYITRYKTLFSSYLSAKSRVASAFITGPANFPVRRNEKAQRSEEKHYEVFREWRERAKRAIIRKSQPEKTYISELERYKSDLESMRANHQRMKDGNKRIAEALKTGADISEYLTTDFGIKPHMIEWTMKFGFGLQNNLANIKRVEQRIKEIEAKEQKRTENPQREYPFPGGKVVLNYEIDRLQVIHDTKPEPEIINNLKRNGFKWSPSNRAWQRFLTAESKYKVNQMFNTNIL